MLCFHMEIWFFKVTSVKSNLQTYRSLFSGLDRQWIVVDIIYWLPITLKYSVFITS